MALGRKLVWLLVIVGVIIAWLGKYVLIILGIGLLLIIIRWLADIFWWGREKGRW